VRRLQRHGNGADPRAGARPQDLPGSMHEMRRQGADKAEVLALRLECPGPPSSAERLPCLVDGHGSFQHCGRPAVMRGKGLDLIFAHRVLDFAYPIRENSHDRRVR
jgi:hypothetical protein